MENSEKETIENKEETLKKKKGSTGSLILVGVLMVAGFGRAALNGLNSTSGIIFLLLGCGWLFVLLSESNKS